MQWFKTHHTCTLEVPNCYVATGVRKTRWVLWNKESSSQWRSPQIGYPHLPTPGKQNGKLRVCLDPWDVNKAIKRDHYKTPTVEEITHLLARSKKFTTVDGTSSYLCIVLDYESSLLTTFNTPWGRYRFVHLWNVPKYMEMKGTKIYGFW